MDSRFHRPQGSSQNVVLEWARLTVWGVMLLCFVASDPALATAKLQQFHIEAGDATLTLNEFSRQSSLQLLFDYNIVRGRKTRAISGEMEAPAALKQMLVETGLVFDFVNERTLAVTLVGHENGPGTAVATAPSSGTTPRSQAETQSVKHEGPGTGDPSADFKAPELEEVRITGTNLRGAAPVGDHVISLDREAMDESGVGTIADFLRTLPQTFGGGPSEDTHIGAEARTNSGSGSGVNLRALGARATLVLVNGKRLAPGGTEAQFVDVESIPMSAVERVDILPDSASALYGADAVGGVVNFVMRDNFTGAETVARGGTGTPSTLGEYRAAQTVGRRWNSGNAVLSMEFYKRDDLPSSTRAYGTSNFTSLGGNNYNWNLSNPGNLIVGGRSYAIPAGQDGTHLTAADLTAGTQNLQDKLLNSDLMPSQKRWSLYASGRQSLTDSVNLFSDVLMSHRDARQLNTAVATAIAVPSSNPFYVNPTGGTAPIQVDYSFLNDLGPQTTGVGINTANITLGFDIDAGAAWRVSILGNYAREKENQFADGQVNFAALAAALADPNPATAFNPFGDGSYTNPATIKGIGTDSRFYTNSEVRSAEFTADGPIKKLPGGAIKLAVGADRREQLFSTLFPATVVTAGSRDSMSRRIIAGFGELTIPVFGKDNGRTGFRRLELSMAARYEAYSDFGHSTTPKYGLLWSPLEALAFRGTWGQSIRAPTLADLNESHNVATGTVLPDASSPTGTTTVLVWGGKNASLREERAKSWTAGLDFKPENRVPGLSVSLTYFNILFSDRIPGATSLPGNILNDPALSDIVIRNPSPTLLDQICSNVTFYRGATTSCTQPVSTVVDLRLHNLEMVATRGVDFTTTYEHAGAYGRLKLGLDGTWLFKFDQAENSGSTVARLLDTQNNPINLRMRGTISWQRSRFGASTGINFQNHYEDVASQPNRNIRSLTTIDAQLRYDLGTDGAGLLHNTRVELNAINVFNVSPPFLNNPIEGPGYDQENADPTGRLLSIQIRKAW